MRAELLHVSQLPKHALRRSLRPAGRGRRQVSGRQPERSRRASLLPLLQLLQMGFRRGPHNLREADRPRR